MLCSGTNIPKWIKVHNIILNQHKDIYNLVLDSLGLFIKILIVLDNWMSSNHLVFMGVTAYYIDKT